MAQLNLNFDNDKLKKDLIIAKQHFQSAPQIGPYHDGSWTGIALRNSRGDYSDTLAFSAGNARDTEVLNYCTYFKQILDNFDFEVEVARLLFLPPDKKVGEHRDQGIEWSAGLARIHIPIVTHEEVYFYINGERAEWKEGEFWYGNFSEVHSIHNKSDITRVHLVMDCAINKNLLALFPVSFITQIQHEEDIFINNNSISMSSETLAKYSGYFTIPKQYLGLPFLSKITPLEDRLGLEIFGLPVSIGLNPTSTSTFEYLDTKFNYTDIHPDIKTVRITNIKRNIDQDLLIKATLTNQDKAKKLLQEIFFKTLLIVIKPFIKLRRRFVSIKALS